MAAEAAVASVAEEAARLRAEVPSVEEADAPVAASEADTVVEAVQVAAASAVDTQVADMAAASAAVTEADTADADKLPSYYNDRQPSYY